MARGIPLHKWTFAGYMKSKANKHVLTFWDEGDENYLPAKVWTSVRDWAPGDVHVSQDVYGSICKAVCVLCTKPELLDELYKNEFFRIYKGLKLSSYSCHSWHELAISNKKLLL